MLDVEVDKVLNAYSENVYRENLIVGLEIYRHRYVLQK